MKLWSFYTVYEDFKRKLKLIKFATFPVVLKIIFVGLGLFLVCLFGLILNVMMKADDKPEVIKPDSSKLLLHERFTFGFDEGSVVHLKELPEKSESTTDEKPYEYGFLP